MNITFDLLICVAGGALLGGLFGFFKRRKETDSPSRSGWQRTATAGAIVGLIYYTAFGSSMFFHEPKNIRPVSEKDFASALATADKPVVVDFFATWCGPCKMLSPRLDKLAGEFSNQVEFLSVDVDQAPELSAKYDVQTIPMILFFNKDRQLTDTSVGLLSEGKLRSRLTALVETSSPSGEHGVAD